MWLTIDAMYRGQRVVYMDYLGYDEVAHHAGHDTEDAKGSLRSFDRHLATIEDALPGPPAELVVLSDHGQSTGWTFKQRYGLSLGDLVQQLIAKGSGETPTVAEGGAMGWGHLNVLLTEIVRTEGVTGRGAKRLLQGARSAPMRASRARGPALVREARDRDGGRRGVAVCPSGNLANIYFTREPGRCPWSIWWPPTPGWWRAGQPPRGRVRDGLLRGPGARGAGAQGLPRPGQRDRGRG